MRQTRLLAIVGAVALGAAAAFAQDAVVRKPLEKSEFPGNEHASHLILVTVAPGGVVAPHTHPGIEMGYMQEGEAMFSLAGQPDRALKAGDTYLVPPNTVHSAKNTGASTIKIIATFVVDKSKPLAAPAK